MIMACLHCVSDGRCEIDGSYCFGECVYFKPSLTEKANAYANSIGYFGGACSAQMSAGYTLVTLSYIQGYKDALKEAENG